MTMDTAQQSQDRAQGIADELWTDTKRSAQAALDEQQKGLAATVHDFAAAMRSAAHDLESRDKASTARYAMHAADGMERLSSTLREKDAASMVRGLESFARTQPAMFFGAAFAAGFLAVRFLKSTEHDPTPTQGDL